MPLSYEDETEICPICLQDLSIINEIFITECNHKFHKVCICNIKTNTCPCCRVQIKIRKGNIKVTIDRISIECYKKICEHYNKEQIHGPIERLDRLEGGFSVEIKKEERVSPFENDRIRQVRWEKKTLVSDNYIGLLEDEIELLYKAMKNVLGEEYVTRKIY